jgi:hypothetical protein
MERAVNMNANLGEDDGQHILRHQDEIPKIFRYNNTYFVFANWLNPEYKDSFYYIYWGNRSKTKKSTRKNLFF